MMLTTVAAALLSVACGNDSPMRGKSSAGQGAGNAAGSGDVSVGGAAGGRLGSAGGANAGPGGGIAGVSGRGGGFGGMTGGRGMVDEAGTSGLGHGGSGAARGEGGSEAGMGGEVGGVPVTCKNPTFTTSDTNGGWSNGGYYVHNNVWNASEAGPETLYACSYQNWYVSSTQPDTTSVKAYPNVHLDIDNLDGAPISNYTTITTTFAASAPHAGIYDVAYDIWLNGVGWGGGTTEVMIWTENRGQVPLGDLVSPAAMFGDEAYDVYRYTSTSDGGVHVISLLSTTVQTAGSVDLKEILNWIVGKGWLERGATINQIGYGVEICSTENQPATFYFTDFSVTMQ